MSSHTRISLIVAASTNNVVGADGGLPWHLGDDLKRFKALTLGKPIIMGRKTFESIGRALPGRQNIIITRRADYEAEGCDVVASPAAALRAAGDVDEVMVIGGGQIYRLFLPMAQRVYLTRVAIEVAGDTTFPSLDPQDWQQSGGEAFAADASNDHAFEFLTYDRVTAGQAPE